MKKRLVAGFCRISIVPLTISCGVVVVPGGLVVAGVAIGLAGVVAYYKLVD